jgi:hypothetical protein
MRLGDWVPACAGMTGWLGVVPVKFPLMCGKQIARGEAYLVPGIDAEHGVAMTRE